MKVTLFDVAKLAGVSTKTVSRVVNNQGEVSRHTRERILALVKELGYRPNLLARGLVNQRSYTIAIVSWTLDRYSPSHFVMGVETEAAALGYSILLTLFRYTEGISMDDYLNSLAARQVDGIIWHAPRIGNNQDWINPAQLSNLPPIVLNGLPNPHVNTVSIDNYHGAYLATRHLVEQGWKRIGIITGLPEYVISTERLRGWKAALEEAGMDAHAEMVASGNWSAESGYQAMETLLQRWPDLDAVFVSDDSAAIGCLSAIRQAGRLTGQNFGLVGYDGQPETAFYNPPLTTIHQPIFELGRKATQLLVNEIESHFQERDPGPPKVFLYQPELVIRQSSLKAS